MKNTLPSDYFIVSLGGVPEPKPGYAPAGVGSGDMLHEESLFQDCSGSTVESIRRKTMAISYELNSLVLYICFLFCFEFQLCLIRARSSQSSPVLCSFS